MKPMRAVGVDGGKGPAEAMYVASAAMPKLSAHDILIEVASAGVNRPDIAQREGNYPPPSGASPTMGLEVAGIVADVGQAVTAWKQGDRVAALLPGGGYATYASVDGRHALPVPKDMDLEAAGALPETLYTVFSNLFERGRLKRGERVLIHGGNSGIGTTAILMAKAAGAIVTTTVRGERKAVCAKSLGANLVVDVQKQDFLQTIKNEGGVDVILDIIGGDYFPANVAALNTDGRLVQIATLGGNIVEADLLQFMFKRLTLVASTLRGRSSDEKARLTAAIRRRVWPWFTSGKVALPIDRKFSLEEVGEAHRWLENGSQFGKVILIP